jgi:HD-GYP domain-containing protein (c-di-GMP phosphodiesterase class II)
MNRKLLLAILLLGLAFTLPAFSQDTAFLDTAMTLYTQNRYQEAFDLIVQSVPEDSADMGLKTSAGEYLTDIGVSEYRRKNYKNAYECFKRALKYSPTNSTATQYYLKIKKEQDVNNLRNEWVPPVVIVTNQTGTETVDGQSGTEQGQSGQTREGQQGQIVQGQSGSSPEINTLLKDLEETEAQLASLKSSDQQAKRENDYLRAQLDQQRVMLQQIQNQQMNNPGDSGNAADQAVIQETLRLLNDVTNKLVEQQSPQIIVQSEPDPLSGWLLIVLVSILGLMVLGVAALIVFLVVRARARRRNPGGPMDGYPLPSESPLIGSPSSVRPLLDFNGEAGGSQNRSLSVYDSGLKRDLLKADHLNRLYEDVRNGTLSWETVRKYIGEMEVELKSAILKIVEVKLDEGDLVANEAILPVLFPFLTDYDAFIREKAEQLARTALLPSSTGKSGDSDVMDEEAGPFDIKILMSIPQKLKAVLKGNDQSVVIAKLSRGIAKQMGLSVNECQEIYKAALAHDAGYLVLDQDRLQSIIAKQDISEEDFQFIQSHTIQGPLYFGELDIPENIRGAMFYHHERNDGSGYPEGLKKEEIPLYAKIIGLSETFAALIARRPHRDKVDYGQALAIIRDSRSKFDREIIEALSKVVQSSGSYK